MQCRSGEPGSEKTGEEIAVKLLDLENHKLQSGELPVCQSQYTINELSALKLTGLSLLHCRRKSSGRLRP